MTTSSCMGWLSLTLTLLSVTECAVRQVSPPTIRPYSNGSIVFTGSVTVTLDINSPETIVYYTLDGSLPTNKSHLFTRPIRLTTVGVTQVRCYAVSIIADRTDSIMVSSSYTIAPSSIPVPTHSPKSGTYRMEVRVTLTPDVDTTVIRYTINGPEPTTSSPQYREPLLITRVGENVLRFFAQSIVGGTSPVAQKIYVIHPALAYEVTTECKECASATAGVPFTVWLHGAVLGAHASMFLTTSSQGCDRVGPYLDDTTLSILHGPSVVFLTNQGPTFVYVCYRDTSSGPYQMVPGISNPRNNEPMPFLVQPLRGNNYTSSVKRTTDQPTLPPVNLVPDVPIVQQEVQSGWTSWVLMCIVFTAPAALIGVYCWRQDQKRRPQPIGNV